MEKDRIYALPRSRVGDFKFDESVVDVFPDMIARSVPGYASILSMIEQLAARYIQAGTNVYDLGCSLGAATQLMRRQAPLTSVIHAVDNSPSMINRLRRELDPNAECRVEIHEADIRGFPIHEASFVVLNLTLQFVPADERQALLDDIYRGMLPNGALLVSEKICFDESAEQALLNELHHDFKRANGYSDLEIAQKRTALENTLITETLDTHIVRLSHAGFNTIVPWFQCFNFVSLLAVKSESSE